MILLLQDKLGISDGYKDTWDSMLFRVGIPPNIVRRVSLYRDPSMYKRQLLLKVGNRKAPGFNPEILNEVREWIRGQIRAMPDCRLILCMDPACLGVIEPAWDISTIDNLRGGVYDFEGIKFLVIPPISVIHSKKNPKDIRAMNDGAESKEEWEEDDRDPEELFIEPYSIPFGSWILHRDLTKAVRLLGK